MAVTGPGFEASATPESSIARAVLRSTASPNAINAYSNIFLALTKYYFTHDNFQIRI